MRIQELCYTLRQLRNAPRFTLTAIAIFALGIGANIAVFTILSEWGSAASSAVSAG